MSAARSQASLEIVAAGYCPKPPGERARSRHEGPSIHRCAHSSLPQQSVETSSHTAQSLIRWYTIYLHESHRPCFARCPAGHASGRRIRIRRRSVARCLSATIGCISLVTSPTPLTGVTKASGSTIARRSRAVSLSLKSRHAHSSDARRSMQESWRRAERGDQAKLSTAAAAVRYHLRICRREPRDHRDDRRRALDVRHRELSCRKSRACRSHPRAFGVVRDLKLRPTTIRANRRTASGKRWSKMTMSWSALWGRRM